jgi:hypothetical protein
LTFIFAVLPIRRFSWRINGKHKITFLCALCDFAVNKILLLITIKVEIIIAALVDAELTPQFDGHPDGQAPVLNG